MRAALSTLSGGSDAQGLRQYWQFMDAQCSRAKCPDEAYLGTGKARDRLKIPKTNLRTRVWQCYCAQHLSDDFDTIELARGAVFRKQADDVVCNGPYRR